jgi:hypothetical protein
MCQDINVGYYFGLERSDGGWDEPQKLGVEGEGDVSGHQSWTLIWSRASWDEDDKGIWINDES